MRKRGLSQKGRMLSHPMQTTTRRQYLKQTAAICAAASLAPFGALAAPVPEKMKLGLVTYLWGKDWDLPTLIANCEKAGITGVETRTQHAHGVEPGLSTAERKEVRRRFADSSVELVGYGSNCQFHESDPAKVNKNIKQARAYIKLMHDCGGTGLKVKPNGFVKGVMHSKTIEQIGKAFNEIARFGAEYGQQIRVEVHGKETQLLPNIKAIMDVADHPNMTVCWNSNRDDLNGKGLKHNFDLVKDRFGDTVHVREMNIGTYPYAELMKYFVQMDYRGWILLECRTRPSDPIAALKEQKKVFRQLLASAKG